MQGATRVECRCCGCYTECQQRTVREREVTIHDEGSPDENRTATDGQCDPCVKQWGDDEYTEPLPDGQNAYQGGQV